MLGEHEGNSPNVGLQKHPRGDSNARTRLRRPLLYPLSYRGLRLQVYHNSIHLARATFYDKICWLLLFKIEEKARP